MPHSKYSPSSSARWLGCTASLDLTPLDEKYQAEWDKSAADRGTLGHEIAERRLYGKYSDDLEAEADEELLDGVDVVVEWVRDNYPMGSGQTFLETRLLSTLVEDFGGTIDVLHLWNSYEMLDVTDFKFGQMKVDVQDNTQLLCYLVLAREHYPQYKRYRGTILQPALNYAETYEFTDKQLDEFYVEVLDATLTKRYRPGPYCSYCPLLWRCEAVTKEVLDAYHMAQDLSLEPDVGDIDRVIRAFKAYKLAKKGLDHIAPIIRDWIEQGLISPTIHGITPRPQTRRGWAPGPDVVRAIEQELGPAAYERRLVSPAQAQKILGISKDDLADLLPVETSKGTTHLLIKDEDIGFEDHSR